MDGTGYHGNWRGRQGTIEMQPYCEKGGVFSSFKDHDYFKNFYIDDCVLSWGDGEVDIAPETLYHKVTGEPYPEWMTV